ncbi:Ger(x)C family spore germination protein [Alicyclobacillus sp. ALC3]|uniref:Ger(x)C family spore germination protein n=1 Tax=Alicyclobacillus sp. ALC3 TaxID=2796143 RepID=UPI002377ED8C|nr:Ger(x)C family spore germination protein [Alicyclobacillus sp. ALC3]WDL98533.1 Ger(x)C family spore germination protein [Alicyclobacillus sp. ALC3]
MKRSAKVATLLLLCLATLGLPGCYGSADIDDLALVMAVGIDKGSDPDSVQVTAQVARPADVVGQTGAPSGGTGEPIWTASATGDSIFTAMRNLGRYSSRRVYWAQNAVVVISEDYARERGVHDVVDFFTRNHELRMRTWVTLTPGQARDIVATKTGLEVVPGTSIEKLFRQARSVAEAPRIDMRTMQADYMSEGMNTVLPVVETESRGVSSEQSEEFGSTPQVELSGAGYFKQGKLAGVLDSKQSQGLMWFIQPPESRAIALPCPSGGQGKASLELKRRTFDVIPTYQRGRVGFDVRLNAGFDIVELGCTTSETHEQVIRQLTPQVESMLKDEIKGIIQTELQSRADFLGLGDRFEDRYPMEWRALRLKWYDALDQAVIRVQVHAHIRSGVLLRTPTRPDSPGRSRL